jgi:hemoglobin
MSAHAYAHPRAHTLTGLTGLTGLTDLTLTERYTLAVAAAVLFAAAVFLVWQLSSPFRRDPAFRRTPAGDGDPHDPQAITVTGGIPRTHRRRPPVTEPADPHPAAVQTLGAVRAGQLLAETRREMATDPATAGHLDVELLWLVQTGEPTEGAIFPDDRTYALTAGHVLAAGWRLGLPDDVLLPIVAKMADQRLSLVHSARFPGPGPDPQRPTPMYDRVGPAALRSLVDQFYSALCGDPLTAPFFQGVDMARLRRHQAAMLSQVLGGPTRFTEADLTRAHAGIGGGAIDDRVYARTAAHALAVAWHLGVPDDITVHLVTALVGLRRLITEASRSGAEQRAERAAAPAAPPAGPLPRPEPA